MRFKTLIKEVKESKLYKDFEFRLDSLSSNTINYELISKAIFMKEGFRKAQLDILQYKMVKYSYMSNDSHTSWYEEHILNTKEDLIVNMLMYFIYMHCDTVEYTGNMNTYFGNDSVQKYVGIEVFILMCASCFIGNKEEDEKYRLNVFKYLLHDEIRTYSSYTDIELIIKHKIKYYG